MDLRHLRHFITIVELGSFSRAAEQVKLTQSALTRSIKTLEKSVGITLLDRSASGAVATRAGAALYENAKFLIHESDRIRVEARMAATGLAGTVNLGINPLLAETHLPRALSTFAEHYERLSIQVQEGDVEETVPLLIGGEIDLILSTVPIAPIRSKLSYERLGSVEWQFYAAPDHPLAQALPGADVQGYRWALLDRQHEMDFVARHFAARNEGMPQDYVRTGSVTLMRSLIVQSGMIGLMPTHYMTGTATVPLPAFGPPILRPVGLITRADGRTSHALTEFVEIFRQEFAGNLL